MRLLFPPHPERFPSFAWAWRMFLTYGVVVIMGMLVAIGVGATIALFR